MADGGYDKVRTDIDTLCEEAHVLLIRAQHDDMKAHIRTAQRDLADALKLMDLRDSSTAPHLLAAVVDATIQSSRLRLQMVEFALNTYGPNANQID